MNSLQLTNKIKTEIDDLTALYGQVLANTTQLAEIDKELLKKTCIELYGLILKLETTTAHVPEDFKFDTVSFSTPTEIAEERTFVEKLNAVDEQVTLNTFAEIVATDSMQEPATAWMNDIESTSDVSSTIEINPVFETPAITELVEIAEQEIAIVPEPSTLNTVTETHKKETYLSVEKTELPAEREISFNEKLAKNVAVLKEEKVAEPKIESLKTAISLNKKIAFVNILFKENVVEYAKSIDKINNSADINEAMRYFSELKYQYVWDEKDELVNELEHLINRKFS